MNIRHCHSKMFPMSKQGHAVILLWLVLSCHKWVSVANRGQQKKCIGSFILLLFFCPPLPSNRASPFFNSMQHN